MRLSIIIPVYKAEKFLSDTLNSVLNQKYKDFQVILVDDGSSDKCGEICDRMALLDNRIVVVHKKNGGVSSARNIGVKLVAGEYIGFVDSDDLISFVMYDSMIKIADEYNADIVQCFHTRKLDEIDLNSDPTNMRIMTKEESLRNLYKSHYTNNFSLCSKIYKRKVFNEITFPEGRVFEDDEVVPKLLINSERFVFVDNKWYCYVKRENSIITAPSLDGLLALTETLYNRIFLLKNVDEEASLLAIRHFMYYLLGKISNCYKHLENLNEDNKELFWAYFRKSWHLFTPFADKYIKMHYWLFRMNFKPLNRWIAKNDFEAIQKILARIKWW